MENSSNIQILRAVESDVPIILSFIRGLAEYEKLSHEMVATEPLLREHLFGPHPAAETLLAQISGNPVGFALFFTKFSTFAGRPILWLEDLFVLPKHRRIGIGRALMRHVAELALQRNCCAMEWTVLDWNRPAVDLYCRLGAIPMSDWTTQRLTGDALLRLAGQT